MLDKRHDCHLLKGIQPFCHRALLTVWVCEYWTLSPDPTIRTCLFQKNTACRLRPWQWWNPNHNQHRQSMTKRVIVRVNASEATIKTNILYDTRRIPLYAWENSQVPALNWHSCPTKRALRHPSRTPNDDLQRQVWRRFGPWIRHFQQSLESSPWHTCRPPFQSRFPTE